MKPNAERALLAVIALAVLAAGTLFLVKRSGGPERPAASAPPAAPSDPRIAAAIEKIRAAADPRAKVVVIGWDGADWELLDRLLADGEMPNLAGLLEQGARGIMDAPVPIISPPIWTSIATGTTPDVHGILDFVAADPVTGQSRPVGSFDRKVPAAWTIFTTLGLKVGVVGWWATWPAESVDGFLVSDRLTDVLMPLAEKTENVVSPAGLYPEVAKLRVEAKDIDYETGHRFADVDRELWELARGETNFRSKVGGLSRILASTMTTDRCARDLAAELDPRLLMLYFEGTDAIGHFFAPFAPPKRHDVSDEDFDRFARTGAAYYHWIDEILGGYRAMLDGDTTLILVSDHGFHWGSERPGAESGAPTAVWWHRREGVFVAAGRGIVPGARGHVKPVDVLPTVLALFNLPPDPAFAGTAAGWCLDETVRARAAGLTPAPYAKLAPERAQVAAELPEAERKAMEEKLQALGYLAGSSSSDASAGGDDGSGEAPMEPKQQAKLIESRRLNNLGTTLRDSGRLDEAEATFRKAIEEYPEYSAPRYNLMLMLFDRGEYDEAERWFWSAVERGLRERERSVVDFAMAYLAKKEPRRAVAILAAGRQRFPDSYVITVNSGTVLAQTGDLAAAGGFFRRALELDPKSTVARNNLALVLLRSGGQAEAKKLLEESLEIDPDQADVRQFLDQLGGR